jgi:1-acyl-sn-glycerol-3-phosphate acyltransferase
MPALYAANHVSWLEVLALGSVAPMAFVAKSEVSRWPFIGSLAGAAGALFLRRGSARAAAAAVDQAVLRLAGGTSVCVFPEGTSTSGTGVLPFKASLFEAAARTGCDVQPVSVSYPGTSGRSPVAPFIGDDDFLSHLLRVLSEEEIVVELKFPPALHGHGRHRSELSAAAWRAVDAALPRDERVTERHPRGVDSPGLYLVPCGDAQ